jgi:subtilisin family serine protease
MVGVSVESGRRAALPRNDSFMLKPRLALTLLVAGILPLAALSQNGTDTLQLGKHEVHATRIIAKYKQGGAGAAQANALAQANVRVRKSIALVPGLVVLEAQELPAAAAASATTRAEALAARIHALQASGQFEYVEPDYTVHANLQPTDAKFQDGTLWGLRNLGGSGGLSGVDINAEAAWDITTGSTNVIVAVIDTGVRYTHQDLVAQMWRNPGESGGGKEVNGVDDDGNGYIDDVFGINSINGSGDPFDDNDHGTHCAGTIGAQANGGGGHVGVAWNVRIMALKFLAASGGGQTSDAIDCLNYAVAKGAKISNNSWGGGGYSVALYDALVAARAANHLFLAAAGNNGSDNDENPSYPSGYDLDNVVSVAALDRADRLANFSNYGQNTVDLGAPGVAIYSSVATTDTSYSSFNGTSMATPHVSGVAALLAAHLPTATYFEIRERLLASTVPIAALAGRCTTGGRLNAFNAVSAAPDGQLEVSVTPPTLSVMLGGRTNAIYVRVTDLLSVTNATVTGTLSIGGSVTFANAGATPDLLANDATYSGNFVAPNVTTNVTLTLVVTAPGKFGLTNVVEYSIIPPPANDNFVGAVKIPNVGGEALALNTFATMEGGEPVHGGIATASASLWWSWSASATGPVLVDTTGSSFDTVLAVYTGNSVATLTQVAAVDNVPNSQAGYLYFNATAANTYRIVVAGTATNEIGTIRLRLTPNGVPDTNAPSVAVTSHLSGSTVITNRLALAGTASDPTPNSSGLSEVQVKLNGSVPATTATGTSNWNANLLLQLGANSLEVWAYDYAGNLSSSVLLTINYFPPPPGNDHFVNAINLTNNSGVSSVPDTALATKEFNEPNHAGNVGGKSVWWKFTAPANGVLSLSTTNSSYDTLLGVYSGTLVGLLTNLASNDDAPNGSFSETSVPVLAGQTYRIAVDGFAGSVGTANLTYAFTTSAVYTVTVSTSGTGTVTPGTALYASNAVVSLTATPGAEAVFSQWTGGMASMANPLSFNVRSDLSLTAVFGAQSHTDGFESGDLTGLAWISSGVPWVVQNTNVSAGTYAARSGVIGHNQTSALILTSDFRAGPGSFAVRVSSEDVWDTLRFFVDGNLVSEWSGEVAWQTYNFNLTAGTHTLEWRYAKDSDLSEGLDTALIDSLDLPVNVPVDGTAPGLLSLRRMSDGTFVVDLAGQVNQTYVVETSANLSAWTPLATNVLVGGVAHIPDPASATNAPRYYRAHVPVP